VTAAAAAMALAACVAPPAGPMVPVVPGPGKSSDAFAADQTMCRQFADSQVALGVSIANQQGFGSALLGTALGAGLGAAIGGGRGAAIGAASGAAVGTLGAAAGGSYAQLSLQQQYDMAYVQCMASKGNRVPGPQTPPPAGLPPGAPVPPPGTRY
jgi:hypothetical protein